MINFPLYIPTGSPGDPYFYLDTLLIHGNNTGGYISTGTVIDSSTATNLIATVGTGTITQGSVNPFGRYWSNYFDGITDYLVIADSPSLSLGSNNFTLECWANIITLPANTGTSGALVLVQKGIIGAGNLEWSLVLYQSGGLYYLALEYTTNGSTVVIASSSSIPLVPGVWNHYSLVKSSTTLYFYFKGLSAGSATIAGTLYASTGTVSIANDSAGASTFLYGYISNLRLVNGNAL
jgi:hypothetical protein